MSKVQLRATPSALQRFVLQRLRRRDHSAQCQPEFREERNAHETGLEGLPRNCRARDGTPQFPEARENRERGLPSLPRKCRATDRTSVLRLRSDQSAYPLALPRCRPLYDDDFSGLWTYWLRLRRMQQTDLYSSPALPIGCRISRSPRNSLSSSMSRAVAGGCEGLIPHRGGVLVHHPCGTIVLFFRKEKTGGWPLRGALAPVLAVRRSARVRSRAIPHP